MPNVDANSNFDERWKANLAAMSIGEKEELLARLLVDLSQQPTPVKPSDWPYDLLMQRKQAWQEGRVQLQDWEDAKRELLELARLK
jgi:hypothetical protein